MALDTGGNPQVDFVWGNTPLLPDTQRTSAVDVNLTVTGIDMNVGVQRFKLSGVEADLANIVVGENVTITGVPEKFNGTYVVSNKYYDAGKGGNHVEVTVLIEDTGITGLSGNLFKSIANNFGGGVGDYSWGLTTKKRSALLNPALDNHSIATDEYNGYPGFTGGAAPAPTGFVIDFATNLFTVTNNVYTGMSYPYVEFGSQASFAIGSDGSADRIIITKMKAVPGMSMAAVDNTNLDWSALDALIAPVSTITSIKLENVNLFYMGTPAWGTIANQTFTVTNVTSGYDMMSDVYYYEVTTPDLYAYIQTLGEGSGAMWGHSSQFTYADSGTNLWTYGSGAYAPKITLNY